MIVLRCAAADNGDGVKITIDTDDDDFDIKTIKSDSFDE